MSRSACVCDFCGTESFHDQEAVLAALESPGTSKPLSSSIPFYVLFVVPYFCLAILDDMFSYCIILYYIILCYVMLN